MKTVVLFCIVLLYCGLVLAAEVPQDQVVDDGHDFSSSFISAAFMMLVSEIGDKTFFIAAIMAMTQDRHKVFLSAWAALALMTVLSCVIGYALPSLIPIKYTHTAAALLFLVFGVNMVKDACLMKTSQSTLSEIEEVENEIKTSKHLHEAEVLEGGRSKGFQHWLYQHLSTVYIETFTMTFLAEWGDRSQIATIGLIFVFAVLHWNASLASSKNPLGVTLGGISGHAFCTGVAVFGGRLIAERISERVIYFVGGILFLVFAIVAFFEHS